MFYIPNKKAQDSSSCIIDSVPVIPLCVCSGVQVPAHYAHSLALNPLDNYLHVDLLCLAINWILMSVIILSST